MARPAQGGGTPTGTYAFFVKRTGIGPWQDLTLNSVSELGGGWATHPRGMVAGVR